MSISRSGLRLALSLVLWIGFQAAGQAVIVAQTPEPQPLPEVTPVTERLQATLSSEPEGSGVASPEATAPVPAEGATSEPAAETSEPEPTPTSLLDGIIETRTPVPTVTPGWIERRVNRFTIQRGLALTEFLGLSASDWINLGISLIYVVVGYLLGTWLIRRILPRLARRTDTEFDDLFLDQAGPGLRWLVVLYILQFATRRLTFVSAGFKTALLDIYFVLTLALAFRILWRMVDLAERWYTERAIRAGRSDELSPVITLLVRIGRVVLSIVGVTILLSHFGINVTGFAAALGIGGLAFSLAARDTIADAIAGFIILVDRPFRIGDRIEIQGEGTWGDVTDIGLRTTRIRTRDNRMVIVPNSVIGSNQVINYSYPDPRYRIETHVGIAYGTDIETAREVIVEAVRTVQDVLPDKPVDALYIDMGDSAMIFRVRWWIESYVDTRRVVDRVHTALQHALDGAGIESPYPTQNVNMRMMPDDIELLGGSRGDDGDGQRDAGGVL
ncbi:MAG: mechanosensitive ion channel domain-containing protein [Anaerolineae bacterium]|jgi:small-conductance mechanosensitive channel